MNNFWIFNWWKRKRQKIIEKKKNLFTLFYATFYAIFSLFFISLKENQKRWKQKNPKSKQKSMVFFYSFSLFLSAFCFAWPIPMNLWCNEVEENMEVHWIRSRKDNFLFRLLQFTRKWALIHNCRILFLSFRFVSFSRFSFTFIFSIICVFCWSLSSTWLPKFDMNRRIKYLPGVY